MSIYRPRRKDGSYKSRFWAYDFALKPQGGPSVRFHGSTGQETKAAAKRVETRIRERAACGQLTNDLTVNEACCRYWDEVGMHQPSSDDTARALEDVKRLMGGDVLLVDITADRIAAAAAQRASESVNVRQNVNGQIAKVATGKTVSLSTVNRQIIEPLRRMLRRARKVWNVPIDLEAIPWNELRYREPAERVRELSGEESDRFWAKLRPDYHPISRFYLLSGRRRSEVVGLMRFDVDLTAKKARFAIRKKRQLTKIAKALTTSQAAIIKDEMSKSSESAVLQ